MRGFRRGIQDLGDSLKELGELLKGMVRGLEA